MAAAEKERLRRWQEHDFYGILGVADSASAADVKRGFRRVALTCHPDKVPLEERAQATKRFQLIAEAAAPAAASGRAPAPGWVAAGSRGSGEVWTRAGAAPRGGGPAGAEEETAGEQDEDAEEALDVLGILLAMGFEEQEARSAAGQAGSVEGAVELLMAGPASAAGQAVLGVAERLGVGGLVQDVGQGVGGLVQGLGQRLSSWTPFLSADPAAELAAQLAAMGYAEDEADAASRRCSSVDAAVEWLSARPGPGQ
ncbi:unnamed protein product [Prorocentrum cordatum]|uniref:J domain-containing protein n=1 Tax=Prorocentrum cordatum TaxID=2364126 RepID=A0ABN9VV54_9DINO|nr:unnamed protein product [Polarella glacialis]